MVTVFSVEVKVISALLNPKVSGGQFTFSFATEQNRNYKVQYTDNVVPANWQTLTDFVGSGGIVTITDPATNPHRFYRVLVQ